MTDSSHDSTPDPTPTTPPTPNPYADQTNPSVVLRLQEIRAVYDKIGLGGLWDTVLLPAIVRDPTLTSRELLQSGEVTGSEVYKQRFRANAGRVSKGLRALNPLDYVQLEETYKQTMAQAGLPKGFYDNPDDFNNWIENDVAPTEVQGRVAVAAKAYEALATNDPSQLQALRDMYGIERDGVMAYFLDGERALGLLERQQNAAIVKGAGANFGVDVSKDRAELLSGKGIGEPEARERFRTIAGETGNAARLGSLYGDDITQSDLVDEAFGVGNAEGVSSRKKKLASQERAQFSGSSGIGQGSLSQKKKSGL